MARMVPMGPVFLTFPERSKPVKVKTLIILLFAVAFMVCTAFADSPNMITESGTEVFDPYNVFGNGVIGEYISPGEVICPGNEPTGNPLQPCPEGSRTQVRGVSWMSRYISDDPQFSGWFTIVANSNEDSNYEGHDWGTFRLDFDSPAGSYMIGSWEGMRVKEGDYWVTPLHATGRIHGGDFDGTNAIITDLIVSYTAIPIAYIGYIDGVWITRPRH
jgi:hypothetical protein